MARRDDPQAAVAVNRVELVGRLGARTDRRVLPSGDELTLFTVVIDRPQRGRGQVDAIACQTTRASVVRRLGSVSPGDWIQVEGSLRRRFWRSGAALRSATEVDVTRLARAVSR